MTTRFGAGLGAMIFGITMFIGGLAALTLPETNNRKVPESIAEANVFMTSSRYVLVLATYSHSSSDSFPAALLPA